MIPLLAETILILKMIELIKDLASCVIDSVYSIEDNKESEEIAFDYMIDYDLGNDNYIKQEDLESLYSSIKGDTNFKANKIKAQDLINQIRTLCKNIFILRSE